MYFVRQIWWLKFNYLEKNVFFTQVRSIMLNQVPWLNVIVIVSTFYNSPGMAKMR